jgi:hypothetical protein
MLTARETILQRLAAPPDGKPRAVMDWPEQRSPTPRLVITIADGELVIRANEGRRLGR